nr:MAG TPA: hypothetical protein [Caudoviricetes sp.]
MLRKRRYSEKLHVCISQIYPVGSETYTSHFFRWAITLSAFF